MLKTHLNNSVFYGHYRDYSQEINHHKIKSFVIGNQKWFFSINKHWPLNLLRRVVVPSDQLTFHKGSLCTFLQESTTNLFLLSPDLLRAPKSQSAANPANIYSATQKCDTRDPSKPFASYLCRPWHVLVVVVKYTCAVPNNEDSSVFVSLCSRLVLLQN